MATQLDFSQITFVQLALLAKKLGLSGAGNGAIAATVSTDGTFAANSDVLIPSQKAAKTFVTTGLATKQNNLGFTPENVANKDIDGTLAANSDTRYASQKATKTYADTKQLDIGLFNAAGRVAFSGTTASFPALKRSSATLQVKLADDSAFTDLSLANLISATAGKGLQLQSGTDQRAGNVALIGGTKTVNNASVTANTLVILTRKTSGGTIGTAITYTLSAGVSFTINSDNPLDTSTFSYFLIEVN